jgi:hypothetical protein
MASASTMPAEAAIRARLLRYVVFICGFLPKAPDFASRRDHAIDLRREGSPDLTAC